MKTKEEKNNIADLYEKLENARFRLRTYGCITDQENERIERRIDKWLAKQKAAQP